MYVDYEYYNKTFNGELIPQECFEKTATRASNIIKSKIQNRSIEYFEDDVKNCTCSIAELLYSQSLSNQKKNSILNGTDKIITSEKVGDLSRNYQTLSYDSLNSSNTIDTMNKEIEDIINDYLSYTGLLYCAVDVR